MAIDFTTYYQRVGKLAEMAIHANTFRGTTVPADIVDIATKYTTDPDMLTNLYNQQTGQLNAINGLMNTLKSLALETLADAVNDDRPLIVGSTGNYLTELDRQQIEQSIELDDSPATVGSLTAGGGNVGDETFVISNKNKYGVVLDTIMPEMLRFDCIVDQPRGAAKWREVFSVYGVASVTDKMSPDWPGGSGSNNTYTLVDTAIDTIVSNAAFDSFTGHIPDDWTVVVGVAETNIEFSTNPPRDEQTYCLKLIGDGSTDMQLKQQVSLLPTTRYALAFLMRNNNLDADTNIVVQLKDGDGNVISDDAGTANTSTTSVNGGAYDNAWGLVTSKFITPTTMPDEIWLHVTTTNLASTELLIADMQLIPMVELYPGGPAIAGISGTVAAAFVDRFTSDITVSGVNTSVVRWMERFYDVSLYGISLRTAASPTSGFSDSSLISP